MNRDHKLIVFNRQLKFSLSTAKSEDANAAFRYPVGQRQGERFELAKDIAATGPTKAFLGIAPKKLLRLPGLAEAAARLSGMAPAETANRTGLERACRIIAGLPPLPGPPILTSVKGPRGLVIGHAPDDACVQAIARGVTEGRSIDCFVEGRLGKVAKTEGLRGPRLRRFSRDPDEHDRLSRALDVYIADWGSIAVVAAVGPWSAAALFPIVSTQAPDTKEFLVLAVLREDGLRHVASVASALPGERARDASDEDAKRIVDRVLKDGHPATAAQISAAVSESDANRAAALSGLDQADFVTGCGQPLGGATKWEPLRYPALYILARIRGATLAKLRRAMGEEARRFIGRKRTAFAIPGLANEFMIAHAGWKEQDFFRMNQACTLYPWVTGMHANDPCVQAIRQGRPMAEALADAYPSGRQKKAHPKVETSLRGAFYRRGVDPFLGNSIGRMAAILDRYFRDDPHRKAFQSKHAEAIHVISAPGGPASIEHAAGMLSCLRGNAKGFCTREDAQRFLDMTRALDSTATQVLEGAIPAKNRKSRREELRGVAGKAVMEMVCDPAGIPGRAWRIEKEWHARVHKSAPLRAAAINRALAKMARQDEAAAFYPHFLTEDTEFEGVTMRPLTDRTALAQEGRDLRHCVGTYDSKAMAGDSMIVSLSSEAGRSTAEFRLVDRQPRPWITTVQHHGSKNTAPPQPHAWAIDAMIKQANSTDLSALRTKIAQARELWARTGGDALAMLSSKDRREHDDLAFEDMRPFLPKSQSKWSRSQWVSLVLKNTTQRRAA